MSFPEVLDEQIRQQSEELRSLEQQLAALRSERDHKSAVLRKALDLYREIAEQPHSLDNQLYRAGENGNGNNPRLSELVWILRSQGRPMAVSEIVTAMSDRPSGGAVSAAAHRALKQGLVRRVQRGVYEARAIPEEEEAE